MTGLKEYIDEIKDAGVAVELINQPADSIRLSIDLHIPPRLIASTDRIEEVVTKELRKLLANLPYDGVLKISQVVDALEGLDEVSAASVTSAASRAHSVAAWTDIEAYAQPHAGYWRLEEVTLKYQPYNSYDRL